MTGERVRVLVVDDEPLARETLRLLMRRDEAIDVVGECRSGLEAVEAIARLAPDLVFLDVQMPELDGFQTLARLPAGRRPIIVFVTAYDRYALKAFDAHALDYLVKPFTDQRFYAALARAKEHVRQRAFGAVGERVLSLLRAQGLTDASAGAGANTDADADTTHVGAASTHAATRATDAADSDGGDRLTATNAGPRGTRTAATDAASIPDGGANMPANTSAAFDAGPHTDASVHERAAQTPRTSVDAPPRLLDRIAVKANGRVTLVRVADIDWIEACDDHIRLHVGAASHQLRQPLKELAARLDARRFVRIHRSAIVNLDRVHELQPHFHGSYLVILKNGASLPLSRARREELRAALGGLLP